MQRNTYRIFLNQYQAIAPKVSKGLTLSDEEREAWSFFEEEQIHLTEHNHLRSDKFNLPGYIADLNLAQNRRLDQYPIQQRKLIEAASYYSAQPDVLLFAGTDSGLAPSRPRRGVITAVLKSVLSHLCYHTWRLGRYTPRGFEEISLLELARSVGFTHWVNSEEIVERSFERAYEQFAAGYIYSVQPKNKTLVTRSGWHRSYKFVNEALVNHMMAAMPGLLSTDGFKQLQKHAKKRALKRESHSLGSRILQRAQHSLGRPDLDTKRKEVLSKLETLGFNTWACVEAAILTAATSLKTSRIRTYGPPQLA